MTFPATTVDNVYAALISAFDGLVIAGQPQPLTSSDKINAEGAVPETQLPYLMWRTGNHAAAEWDRWTYNVKADIPASLKIAVNYADSGLLQIRQALDDIYWHNALIRGMHVTEAGRVVPYTPENAELFYETADVPAKVQPLIDRMGPILRTARVTERPGFADAQIDLSFAIEININLDRREFPRARVVTVGATILDAPGRNVDGARWLPNAPAYPEARDVFAGGQFNTEAPEESSSSGGPEIPSDAPGTESAMGPDPDSVVAAINVTPYSASIGVAGTQQMKAIARFQSGRVQDVTILSLWQAIPAITASVDSAGLVTGILSGSSSVSASFEGVTSNTAVITVS